MKKTITLALMLVVSLLGFTIQAQAPQTGVYRIQNAGAKTYVKVTGKYDAQLVSSQSDASYITVGIEKKLSDGTYKVNSLYSTYDGGSVEVYDYLTKALTLGEIELRRELAGSSEPNIQRAISRMHELVQEYGFMRMMPVDGQADTYHAIAVLPTIPSDIVEVWQAKKNPDGSYESTITHGNTMWDWCIDIVYRYLDEHSGAGGTNAGLAAKIRNNLKNIKEGHTYMLTVDADGSFGYFDTDGALTSSNDRSWWKLTPKVNTADVKDGTYKIRNLGTEKYVRITGKYHARPDAEEDAASDIRITFNGTNENGDQKVVNLGGNYNGTDIDIYSYIEKAILIGKVAIADVLKPGNSDGVNPASPENVVVAQETMEKFVKDNAFMSLKPVEGKDDAVYAYAYIPAVPAEVAEAMYEHGALSEYGVTSSSTIAEMQAAAWQFGVKKVKDYLNAHSGTGGTDNTLRAYILANIDNIQPATTYYLSAHETDGSFDYAAEGQFEMTNEHFMWGFDVEDVEEENLTSGTYKIRNVKYENFVEVLSKYYAKPDTDEDNATEIHITYDGKLDDGSYKVVNMSAVAKDGSMCDIKEYVEKAIMLGKIAIADVLSGKVTVNGETVHQASPENIAKAQEFMANFVRSAAFMRVKPVIGTNYVYAIATIPEIPAEVVEQMVAHIDGVNNAQDCWNYGKQYVLKYLEGHPNSTLASLITNNINNLTPGHTYYLSEDADHTFGYKDYDNGEVNLDDKTIQWGIDLEEEDQPVESDFYKIHNVGNDRYVKVLDRYYARPMATEAEATPIAVTIDGMLEDGSMKVTNLVGDGHDIQKYVQHAIELGTAMIHKILDGVSSTENINRAIEEMTNFVNENAYMRVKLVPGETDAYYAYVVMPTVPEYIVNEWKKKYPNYNGTMRDWAVEMVEQYLDEHPQVDGKLAAMVRANIGRIYEGHTYYLRADGDYTFGFADATVGEMDFGNSDAARYYWWGFADAIKAEPVSGYFRIKGADGNYVNVTGKFDAKPNASAADAKTAAGTVIYVGTGETKNTKTLPIEILRSQGVDVGATSGYMFMINDVLKVVANKVAEIAEAKVQESSYSQYAGLIQPAVSTLLESVDMNLYMEPTLTSTGEEAYMLEVNIPDLAEYVDLANSALSLMGKNGAALARKIREMKKGNDGAMNKLLEAAAQCAELLDGQSATEAADDIWALLKQKGKTFLSSYSQQLSALLPEQAITFINNALNNPDFNYGTTYCLRQDADHTFGYASRETMADNDAAKWILEPFSEEDPNYNADTYVPFYLKAELGEKTYTDVPGEGVTIVSDETYYFTTTYLDFDAKIESEGVNVYTISETKRETSERKATATTPAHTFVYYIAELTEVTGEVIPAGTPVIVRTAVAPADAEEAGLNVTLRPVGVPTHPAVESDEYLTLKDEYLQILIDKIEGATTQNAPSPKVISQQTTDNLLVGSFFGEPVESGAENSYLVLSSKELRQDNQPVGLDMQGVGFWKDNTTSLDGNAAYLYGDENKLTDFLQDAEFSDGSDGIAPGYIFQYPDGTYTRIENVNTNKEVKSVRYYNTLGIESTTPFQGVNIIVTTFTDGTSVTGKVIK